MVVTLGRGAVSKPIDPKVFHATYSSGNGTFYMTSMPSATAKGNFLTGKYERWAHKAESGKEKYKLKLQKEGIQYYKTKVEYEYRVINGTTVDAAVEWMNEDPQGRGVIIDAYERKDIKSSDDYRLTSSVYDAGKKFQKDPAIGGYGQNEGYAGFDYNLIILNPNTTMNMSSTERAVHEGGHNAAAANKHGTGYYEYNQGGLQSNEPGSVYPNRGNTKTIINDKTNRQTIEK